MRLTLDDRGVIVTCAQCGQKNRTPFDRLDMTGTCGKCKADLPPPSTPIEIDSEAHFQSLTEATTLPTLVDFWAPWCGPCKSVAPELEKVAASMAGRLLVAKVNADAVPALGKRFSIQSIPTMALIVEGREVKRTMGARPAAAIEEFVKDGLAKSGGSW